MSNNLKNKIWARQVNFVEINEMCFRIWEIFVYENMLRNKLILGYPQTHAIFFTTRLNVKVAYSIEYWAELGIFLTRWVAKKSCTTLIFFFKLIVLFCSGQDSNIACGRNLANIYSQPTEIYEDSVARPLFPPVKRV